MEFIANPPRPIEIVERSGRAKQIDMALLQMALIGYESEREKIVQKTAID